MPKHAIEYTRVEKRTCWVEAENCMDANKKFREYLDVIKDEREYTLSEEIKHVYLDE